MDDDYINKFVTIKLLQKVFWSIEKKKKKVCIMTNERALTYLGLC